MNLMGHGHLDAVFSGTETITERGMTVDQFPRILSSRFVSDVSAGQALFPSYGHPFAALFTRKVLQRVPIYDGTHYHNGNALPFNVGFMNSCVIITALSDIVRRVRLHRDNDTGILNTRSAMELATDIRQWRDYIDNPVVIKFQSMIADYLESDWIKTFREITALVDEEFGN